MEGCRKIVWLLVLVALACSCHTPKRVTTGDSVFEKSCYSLTHISINKCKLNVGVGGKSQQLNGNIYICRDSVVYFRGTLMGLEVLRGVVLRDSFAVISRLDRICYQGSNSYLSRMAGYPVNPTTIEMLLTADGCVEKYRSLGFYAVQRDHQVMLSYGNSSFEINITPETQTTESVASSGGRNQPSFRANYLNHTSYPPYLLPATIDISAFDGKTTFRLQADFHEITFNEPHAVNFSIPKNYQMVDL